MLINFKNLHANKEIVVSGEIKSRSWISHSYLSVDILGIALSRTFAHNYRPFLSDWTLKGSGHPIQLSSSNGLQSRFPF